MSVPFPRYSISDALDATFAFVAAMTPQVQHERGHVWAISMLSLLRRCMQCLPET
jgi:hypothetical protein